MDVVGARRSSPGLPAWPHRRPHPALCIARRLAGLAKRKDRRQRAQDRRSPDDRHPRRACPRWPSSSSHSPSPPTCSSATASPRPRRSRSDALKGLAILVAVWFIGSWLGSRVRQFGEKVGRRRFLRRTDAVPLSRRAGPLWRLRHRAHRRAPAVRLPDRLARRRRRRRRPRHRAGAAGHAQGRRRRASSSPSSAPTASATPCASPARTARSPTSRPSPPCSTPSTTARSRSPTTRPGAMSSSIQSARSLRRLDLAFSISYGDDIDRAIEVIRKVLKADPRVRDEPPIWIKVAGPRLQRRRSARPRLVRQWRLGRSARRHAEAREAGLRSRRHHHSHPIWLLRPGPQRRRQRGSRRSSRRGKLRAEGDDGLTHGEEKPVR